MVGLGPESMSIFDYRKPVKETPARDSLQILRDSLQQLEADPNPSPRIENLKQILQGRIAELEATQRLTATRQDASKSKFNAA